METAGVNALQSYCSINVDVTPDPGHGVWNGAKLAFQQTGLWNHVNLMILTWSTPHGPWSEDQRYQQLKRHWRNILDTRTQPEDSPLFMSLIHRMIFDLNFKGDNRSLAHYMWDKCKSGEWDPWESKRAASCPRTDLWDQVRRALTRRRCGLSPSWASCIVAWKRVGCLMPK